MFYRCDTAVCIPIYYEILCRERENSTDKIKMHEIYLELKYH